MEKFEDKVAIVTGAASGIGRAVALLLAKRGAKLTLADVDAEGMSRVAMEISAAGSNATVTTLDVSNAEAVQTLVKQVVTQHERLDYLFNIAGIAQMSEVRDMRPDDWRRIVDVNLLGVINGTTAAYQIMTQQGYGHIVNMASFAGLAGSPTMTAYAMTKAAVIALSTSLRAEAEAFGVKVSVICPSFVESRIYENAVITGITRPQVRKLIPFKLVDTERAAHIILAEVTKNKAVVVFPRYARVMWFFMRLLPSIATLFHRKMVKDFRAAQVSASTR